MQETVEQTSHCSSSADLVHIAAIGAILPPSPHRKRGRPPTVQKSARLIASVLERDPESTQQSIGDAIGVTRQRVQQLFKQLRMESPQRRRRASRVARIAELVASNPSITRREIADALSISQGAVGALCVAHGIRLLRQRKASS